MILIIYLDKKGILGNIIKKYMKGNILLFFY